MLATILNNATIDCIDGIKVTNSKNQRKQYEPFFVAQDLEPFKVLYTFLFHFHDLQSYFLNCFI